MAEDKAKQVSVSLRESQIQGIERIRGLAPFSAIVQEAVDQFLKSHSIKPAMAPELKPQGAKDLFKLRF